MSPQHALLLPEPYVGVHQPLTPAQAAQHLLNRRLSRTDVVTYAGVISVPGRPVREEDPDCELFRPVETHLAEHMVLILRAMERTFARRYGRLLIMMPPGGGKTTYASVVFPSHHLGAHAGFRLGLGSYGDDLALKMGRKTRAVIQQPRYKSIFKTELSRDSRAGNQFQLTNGSEYMAASIGGAFPGNRLDGAIADDPIKGRTEASSETVRATTWDEYKDNFVTRLVPGGPIVLIMTHWDEEDPAGHILPDGWSGDSGMFVGKHDGLDWEVLCLQAKCETTTDPLHRKIGEYFWPEWFDAKHWQQFESDIRSWNSLYQQRPRPLEGAFFAQEDMLVNGKPIEDPQRVDYVYAIIDSAMKDGKPHDGLAVMFFARSKLNVPLNPPLAVLDWDLTQIKGAFLNEWLPSVFVRGQQLAKDCSARLGFIGAFIEDKSSGTVLLQQTKHQTWVEAHPDWAAHAIPADLTAQGKKGKAINVAGYVHAGMVKWTRRAWERVCTFKGVTKNHALGQVLKFSPDTKDTDPDDCLDDFTYGVALGLGNRKGF